MARELPKAEVHKRVTALLAGMDPAVEHLLLRLYWPVFEFSILPPASDNPRDPMSLRLRAELYRWTGDRLGEMELGAAHVLDVLHPILQFAGSHPLTVSLYLEEQPIDRWTGGRPLLHANGPETEAQCAALLEERGYKVERGEGSLRVYRERWLPPRSWRLLLFPLYLFMVPLGMLFGISPLRTLRSYFRSVLTGKRVYVEVGLVGGKVWGRLGEDGDEYELGCAQVAASDILALHFTPGRGNEPFEVPGTLYCLLRDQSVALAHMLPEVSYSNRSARPFYEEGLALRELLACTLIRARGLDQA